MSIYSPSDDVGLATHNKLPRSVASVIKFVSSLTHFVLGSFNSVETLLACT